jgi:hypothetical protein
MLKWFKPEYRIVQDSNGIYSAEVRRLWWPFWHRVLFTSGITAEHTERKLEDVLKMKRNPTVKYLGRI